MAEKPSTLGRANGSVRPEPENRPWQAEVARILAPLFGQDGLVIVMSLGGAQWAAVNGAGIIAYGVAAYGITAYFALTWLRLRR